MSTPNLIRKYGNVVKLTLATLLAVFLLFPFVSVRGQAKGDVLVSEILFNPVPGGSDYVEFYNAGDVAVNLKSLKLARVSGDSIVKLFPIADSGLLAAHDYLVVTTDASFVRSSYTVRYPSKMVEVKSMPSYNDASGSVVICTADSLVLDRFDYDEKMHSRLLRDREGVALERRSFNAATQDASNWYSAATTAGYGTPTYSNSQSHEFLFMDDAFAVSIPVFSPDGDGYNDLLDISYSLTACDMSANITVYDSRGRQVRLLARGSLLGCSGVLTWDGTDDTGHNCLRGKYIVVVEVFNDAGVKQKWHRTIGLVRE